MLWPPRWWPCCAVGVDVDAAEGEVGVGLRGCPPVALSATHRRGPGDYA